jgi:hypothetical protein
MQRFYALEGVQFFQTACQFWFLEIQISLFCFWTWEMYQPSAQCAPVFSYFPRYQYFLVISTTNKTANTNFPTYTHLTYTGIWRDSNNRTISFQISDLTANNASCAHSNFLGGVRTKSPSHHLRTNPISSSQKKNYNTTKIYHNQRKLSWPIRQQVIA